MFRKILDPTQGGPGKIAGVRKRPQMLHKSLQHRESGLEESDVLSITVKPALSRRLLQRQAPACLAGGTRNHR